MALSAQHIAALYHRAQAGTLTPEEAAEWEAFLSACPEQATYLARFDESETLQQAFVERSPSAEQEREERMLQDILRRVRVEKEGVDVTPAVHRVHFLKTAWLRYAAAIIILFGIGTYIWINNIRQHPPALTTTTVSPTSDIAPGYSKATLTLSDGKTVELNKNATEKISDGALFIDNNNGELIYRSSTVVAMNTMTTPKGGQYQLTLADGTRVWLNAASSITYPTAFTGKTREVIITGEAYFEVAPNKAQPFVVKTNKEDITVLGTSFNVHAYADEAATKTSLIDGAIEVGKKILKPGQAYINGQVVFTDLQQDIAWKNGVFNFNNTKLEDAMKQIARWYDVDVRYEGNMQEIMLGGEIGRRLTLEQLMRGLEGIDDVHFQLSGRTLIIKP